jgi:hypothetical protein
MAAQELLKIGIATVLCGAACCAPLPAVAATDGFFVAPPPQGEAPSYDSNYGAQARLRGVGTSPEADARPGEYYFVLAAHAYRTRDYAHAIEMYQVAASWAFKPAEYNLGVMYARGQGVPIDLPRAMAWMALAAERNEPHYVDAREAIYAEMSKEQFEQANVIWRELKPTYGDDVALKRAKARWAEVRSHMTGSRVGSAGNLQVAIPGYSSPDTTNPKIASEQVRNRALGLDGFGKPLPHDKGESVGANYPRSSATTSAEALGGDGVDGVIAYRQLFQSDNPYDPKFERRPTGIATVGAPTTVGPKGDDGGTPDSQPPQNP